jgi:hypothetical protein
MRYKKMHRMMVCAILALGIAGQALAADNPKDKAMTQIAEMIAKAGVL